LSPNESDIFCIFDENLCFLNGTTGTAQAPLKAINSDPVNCFCISPNGDDLVVATKNSLLRHFKLSTSSCIRSLKAHQMPVLTMAYDPTGTLVATGSADRSVRVWDIEKGYCTHSFKEHTDIVNIIVFHWDYKRLQLFSVGDDNAIRIYGLSTSACQATFRDHVSSVTQLAVSPDGNILVSSGRDKVTFREF
jgi:U3 small nucleolar RNA-associated protein 13